MKRIIDLSLFKPINCNPIPTAVNSVEVNAFIGGAKLMLQGTPSKLGGVDWNNARYLVFDVLNQEDISLVINLEFWKKSNTGEKSDLVIVMGILPKICTRLSFPLDALNSQELFLDRTPGKLKTVVLGNKLELSEVDRITIGTAKSSFQQKYTISNLHLTDAEPEYSLPDLKMVDELGQWALKAWPGKTADAYELSKYLAKEYNNSSERQFHEAWSSYGGWKQKRFEATGFFRTQHDGKRWWLVDPEGYAFYSMGMDVVAPGESGPITDIEGFFSWLPECTGDYKNAYVKHNNKDKRIFINFGIANLIRAFGSKWQEHWTTITKARLLDWGFNTIGNWTPHEVIRSMKLPYVWPLKDFPETKASIFRDFPDVFSKEYEENAEAFAEQVTEFVDDRNLIGYFLRNEPQWAFVNNLNLAEELLENHNDFASKEALISFLSKRYDGQIEKLNTAWNKTFSAFEQLKGGIKNAAGFSPAASKDLSDFSKLMIDRYVRLPSEALKKADPNHLNLGMRYAWISSGDLLAGSGCFDVFSINCYKLSPLEEIENVGKLTGLPVMIGEFHNGALDRGLPSTGLRAVTNQKERGKAYRYYMENAASSVFCVGVHYFILYDQAVLGRFDGENYQIGFTDVCHKPYEEIVQAAKECHRILYEVVEGTREKFDEIPEEIEFVAF